MFEKQNQVTQNPTAADTPQQTPTLAPEAIVEQLRAINAQIPEVQQLTPQQRHVTRNRARTAKHSDILQTSISMIGTTDVIANAVGHEAPEVRAMCDESNRWAAVEDELRAMLSGVAGANLLRQQRLADIAERAYGVGLQLVRDPEHAALIPHVQEIKRLKKIGRRKKPATAPQTPPVEASEVPKG